MSKVHELNYVGVLNDTIVSTSNSIDNVGFWIGPGLAYTAFQL